MRIRLVRYLLSTENETTSYPASYCCGTALTKCCWLRESVPYASKTILSHQLQRKTYDYRALSYKCFEYLMEIMIMSKRMYKTGWSINSEKFISKMQASSSLSITMDRNLTPLNWNLMRERTHKLFLSQALGFLLFIDLHIY